jgi:hypothetical protein
VGWENKFENMPVINHKTSESQIISSASIDKIFANGEFNLNNGEKAKYIWKVEQDNENGFTIWNQKRLKIQLTYNQTSNEITGITLKKFDGSKETGCVSINKINLTQIQEFLNHITKIDLKAFATNRVFLNGNDVNNQEIIKQINTLLNSDNKINLIKTLLEEGNITNEDIVNTGFRKKSLAEFEEKLKQETSEKDWQVFFEKNKWIFGFGLDYRFIESSNREVEVGYGNVDFVSFNKFSVLIEIKTHKTPLIKKSKIKNGEQVSPNRADAWSLSDDLINSVSQILAYKANWQLEYKDTKNQENYDSGISNYTADPKAILVIGNFKSIFNPDDDRKIQRIKQETFELFRRDSRNIEIITYDELFERASYIVNEQKMPDDYLQKENNSL